MAIKQILIAALTCAALGYASAPAAAQAESTDNFESYSIATDLAVEVFFIFLKTNGAAVRVAAGLNACEQKGLAKAVENTIKDRKFLDILSQRIKEGKFKDMPHSAVFQVQSAAIQ